MNRAILTDVNIIINLYKIGLLKYFNNNEIKFFITDLNCDINQLNNYNQFIIINKLCESKILEIVKLDEDDVKQTIYLSQFFYPKFTIKVISTFVYAKKHNVKIISDDYLVNKSATEINLRSYTNEWLASDIVNELRVMGIHIDLDIVKSLII